MPQPRERYATVINNQLDHSALVAQLDPAAHTYVDRVTIYGIPATVIESTDSALLARAPELPAGQCCSVGPRDKILADWFMCVDQFRVAVRPEHLTALHNATTLAEFQAARAAIQADTSYPPPAQGA